MTAAYISQEGVNFMDITSHPDLSPPIRAATAGKVTYPSTPTLNNTIRPLLSKLEQEPMRENLVKLTSFYTRYYQSSYGAQSSQWLQGRVAEIVNASGAMEYGATVKAFPHPWGQNSVIATIPGKSNKTVVIGAHQDSINAFLPSILAAPGADDDGSGTVTILEALRVLLMDDTVKKGKADNTVEFHWYSAEEGGLLGSQAIFSKYRSDKIDVRAMLQQDMTGFVQKTLDAGKPESVGVVTDFVDPGLTEFIKHVITDYCDIPFVLTRCGYACSDHASAGKAGYPSAFVIEAEFSNTFDRIHTEQDRVEYVSFPHMLQHAKLTLGLAYELAFAKLSMS
jgi:bacterial leucyl aminopeptidase